MVGQKVHVAAVIAVEAKVIHPQPGQGVVGDFLGQTAVTLDRHEIDDPAQQATGDARCATGAAGNLAGAKRIGTDPQQPRAAGDDKVKLVLGIELQPCRDAEPVAQRRGQEAKTGGGADEGEGLQLDPHGAGGGTFADHQIQREIFEGRIEHLFDHGRQAVNLVDEQHVAGFQIGQDRGQIAGLGQNGAGGHAKTDAKLARHDLREGGLAQTGGAVEQGMVHRLAPHLGAFDEHRQIGAGLGLTGEFRQRLGPQGAVGVFGQAFGGDGAVGGHRGGHQRGASSLRAARIMVAVSASGVSALMVATAWAASPWV